MNSHPAMMARNPTCTAVLVTEPRRVATARSIGAAGVSFYNYGLLSAARLEPVRRANQQTQ